MSNPEKKPLLISIVGPTAVGKTAVSIALAKHFDTEIISADSRQMYRDIPIGTACPSIEEQDGVKHHFLAHLDLEEEMSAGTFEREVLSLIEGPLRNKEVIILSGGSGLYVRSVLEGLDDVPKDAAIRETLNARLTNEGLPSLLKELESLDPESTARIDVQNPQRVIRALEVCLASGKTYSSFLNAAPRERPFDSLLIGLRMDRSELKARIAERCEVMMASGWIEEARSVYADRHLNSLRTIGYKELFAHFDGDMDLDACKAEVIKGTHRFAKRQMTWFNKMKKIYWIDLPAVGVIKKVIQLKDLAVHR